jgi:hypothetical protein
MNAPTKVEVELHSTEPSAVDATVATIEDLGGRLLPDADGRWFLFGYDKPLDFIVWAAERQGYVKRVIRERTAAIIRGTEAMNMKKSADYENMLNAARASGASHAELARLRARVAELEGLLHSEAICKMHYCERHEMAYQRPEHLLHPQCPHCECERLERRVEDLLKERGFWKAQDAATRSVSEPKVCGCHYTVSAPDYAIGCPAHDPKQRTNEAVPYAQQSAEWRAGYDEAEQVYHAKQAGLRRELREARTETPVRDPETLGDFTVGDLTTAAFKVGWARGIEAAAKTCEAVRDEVNDDSKPSFTRMNERFGAAGARVCAERIRALAVPTGSTPKP